MVNAPVMGHRASADTSTPSRNVPALAIVNRLAPIGTANRLAPIGTANRIAEIVVQTIPFENYRLTF